MFQEIVDEFKKEVKRGAGEAGGFVGTVWSTGQYWARVVNISIITWLVVTVLMSTAALSGGVLVLAYLPVLAVFVLMAEGAIFFYISFANKHVEKLRRIVFSVFGVQIAAALALAAIPLHNDPKLVPWFMAAVFGAVFLTLGHSAEWLGKIRAGLVVAILVMAMIFFAGGREEAKASAGGFVDNVSEPAAQTATASDSNSSYNATASSYPQCESAVSRGLNANATITAQHGCWSGWHEAAPGKTCDIHPPHDATVDIEFIDGYVARDDASGTPNRMPEGPCVFRVAGVDGTYNVAVTLR